MRVPGGSTFFTVTLLDRGSDLLVDRIDALRAAVRRVWGLKPSHIDAWVVLPENMHTVWTLPEGDVAYSARRQAIKMGFQG